MAGLTDMAGLTPPMGQWQSLQGQNMLEIPQVYHGQHDSTTPQAMAQMLQNYLLTGHPHGHHAQNSHADQRQYGPMHQIGNPWDASGLPPYPPGFQQKLQQAVPGSQQIQQMLQRQPVIPPGNVLSPSEVM